MLPAFDFTDNINKSLMSLSKNRLRDLVWSAVETKSLLPTSSTSECIIQALGGKWTLNEDELSLSVEDIQEEPETVCVGILANNDNTFTIPQYHSSGAAGCDICSNEAVHIPPHAIKLIHTGLVLEIPEGYEAQVRTRSGMALKHSIFVLNSPGTIDSDYRGEVCVILCNIGDKEFLVERNMRIAQLVFAPTTIAHFKLNNSKGMHTTERGDGGFGSTGE